MKKHIIYLILYGSFLIPEVFGQEVKGIVYCESTQGKKETLPGAHIVWLNAGSGVITGKDGTFSIPFKGPDKLIVSFTGFASDTVLIDSAFVFVETILRDPMMLQDVEVTARSYSTSISMIKPFNMEVIGQAEIKKAACCNLSESFESNASVDVVYGDAVSGAKAIQMLGLSGVYTQMQIENVPLIRGMSASFGMQYIPGTWLESIQITKGVGSVVNGYESMSGQINVELLKPENDKVERWFFNLYTNHLGREEANIHYRKKINDKLSTLILAHGSGYFFENDQNRDGFRDNPLGRQLNVMNRWKLQGKKTEQVFGIHAVYDNKNGGQLGFVPSQHQFTYDKFGVGISTQMIEGFFKNGFLFPSSPTKSMGLIISGKHHTQDTYYGLRSYFAEQRSAYTNLIFQDIIGTTMHNYKLGLSTMLDDYRERYRDSLYNTLEIVPGVFGEYTYSYLEKFQLLIGARYDFHNRFGGVFSPRAHIRFSPNEHLTIRLTGGQGFRSPRIFMENVAPLASARQVVITEELGMERSTNFGGSITTRFKFLKRESSFNIDYYHTRFENQVIADMDLDAHKIVFYNLKGESFSNSLQAEVDLSLYKGLSVKIAYKRYQVMVTYHDTLMERPMVPRDRVMMNLSYETPSKKWKFDLISNYYSSSRLPNTESMTSDMRFPSRSQEYYIVHFQITKQFRKFEWYIGGENLLNFVQQQAIMSADNPFGPHFDASMIWGPLNGRTFYSGIRISIR
ncbi:MAG TPA: TonB-dependent receptor [Flavobacteriales bacterium]|nr:TonB-dependent receptor [Flavobacteriales bacterium]HRJ34880.1 TonB-dependent receptor [Flavobacteriales bacterium]HRJ38555.1 TonB-dependent receptor [Flavobacteriales bacterium]